MREIVEIVRNQKDGRQIVPSRSPLKDLSVCGEVGADCDQRWIWKV
jgi:hypothetical protein